MNTRQPKITMQGSQIAPDADGEAEGSPDAMAVDLTEEINNISTFLGGVNVAQDSYLEDFGIQVNKELNCLICFPCGVALKPLHVLAHLREQHKGAGISVDTKRLQAALDSLSVGLELPAMETAVKRPEIDGLTTYPGIQCQQCMQCFRSQASILIHHRTQHQGVPLPPTWTKVHVQQLNRSNQKSFFPVQLKQQHVPNKTDEIIQSLRTKHNLQITSGSLDDSDLRLLSPWLKSTRWTELIKDHNITELRNLVALPKKNEFPGLKDVLTHLMFVAEEGFDKLPVLVLQRLNSPDPAKSYMLACSGISNTPFHRMANHRSAIKEYLNPLIRLVAMLFRLQSKPIITHVLPETATKLILRLHNKLTSDNYKEHIIKAQTLLIVLWTKMWSDKDDGLFADPTTNMLALMMLNADGSFKGAQETTKPIAQLEYCMRMCFMVEILKQSEQQKINVTEAAQSLEPWFIEKHESTFNSLRSLQHRASAIAMATMAPSRIYWKDRESFDSLLFEGNTIEFGNISKMFMELERESVEIWEQDILRGLGVHRRYSTIADDMTNTEVGYSFLSDPRNVFSTDRDCLFKAIMADKRLSREFITHFDATGAPVWNKVALRTWLVKYAQFEGLLLLRSLMIGGAPARITEITAMTYRNIPTTVHRNLMAFDQYIAILVMYHKGSEMSGLDKLIPHALDGVTADLVVQNLTIARPFAELASMICNPDDGHISAIYYNHLFVNNGRLFTTTDVTNIMKTYSLPTIGYAMGVQSWRHICIAFKRKRCPDLEEIIADDQVETVEAQQATHTRRVENMRYALSSDSLSGISEDVLPLFLDASTDWQLETRMVPGGLGLSYKEARSIHFIDLVKSGKIKERKRSKQPDMAVDLEALAEKLAPLLAQKLTSMLLPGISETIQGLLTTSVLPLEPVQARPELLPFQKANNQSMRREASPMEVTEHSMFDSERNVNNHPMPEEASPIELTQHSIFDKEDQENEDEDFDEHRALETLQTLVGNSDATWTCSEQLQAVMAALDGKRDMCVIIRTGGGKTMVPLIASQLDSKTVTIIVLPLRSLLLDYQRKLDAMHIKYEVYINAHSLVIGRHGLVLLTIDMFRTRRWTQTLAEINERKGVKRLCFDEAHYALTANDFRKVFLDMDEVRTVPAQIILLSGTVPPKGQKTLLKAYALQDDCLVFRTPTDRPELEYVLPPRFENADAIVRETKRLYNTYKLMFEEQDRALIFVPYLEEGRLIAEALGCEFYQGSKELTTQEQGAVYTRWIEGIHKAMICTNAFSAGNDYPHVRLVIHAGAPLEMLSFIQEVSRGGRDGQKAKSYILIKGRPSPPNTDDLDFRGSMAVWTMLYNSNVCLRFLMTSFSDGVGLLCQNSEQRIKCSRCSKTFSPGASTADKRRFSRGTATFEKEVRTAKKAKVERQSTQQVYINNFINRLRMFENLCAFCDIFDLDMGYKHSIMRCRTLYSGSRGTNVEAYKAWKQSIRYNDKVHGNVCFYCHIPQVDDSLHDTFDVAAGNCSYQDILPPAAFAIYHHPEFAPLAKAHFQVDWETDLAFAKWLSAKPATSEHRTNMAALFHWYCDERGM
ncbi:hypothetical protein H0H93_012993 [Arthromyces matolae]|nr:hypothetical protein H0H93_012993 [Arthromyces matolae]